MAEHAETLESARQDGLDLHDGVAGLVRRLEATAQIDLAAVHLRREGMPGDVSFELLKRFADGGARAYVSPRQILDVDAHVVHLSPPSRSRASPETHEARDHVWWSRASSVSKRRLLGQVRR
jgi:hypothetical protein